MLLTWVTWPLQVQLCPLPSNASLQGATHTTQGCSKGSKSQVEALSWQLTGIVDGLVEVSLQIHISVCFLITQLCWLEEGAMCLALRACSQRWVLLWPESRLGGDSTAPGVLTKGQVVAGTHCTWSHLHLGLARPFYWPHLQVCWVLSTGFCSMQRAHRYLSLSWIQSLPALPGELLTRGELGELLAEQELGFPGAEERWFHAVPMTCKHGWRPGEDSLSATGLSHSEPLYAQVCFELDALTFADGWGQALKLSYRCFYSLSLICGEVVNGLVAWLFWDIPIFGNILLLGELSQRK